MKRRTFPLFSLLIAISVTFLFYTGTLPAAEDPGKHGEPVKEAEEIPFDRPVEEIQKFLEPMNQLKIFKELEIDSCNECHDEEWETNAERRDLEEPHDQFPGKFINHDSENRWCLDCHSPTNKDKFRLINGKEVPFNEYYRVCEQCHKRVYREWKMGIHGKRTGNWNGEKRYKHCTQCHNPHDPPFKAIKPMPVPRRPENARVDSAEAGK